MSVPPALLRRLPFESVVRVDTRTLFERVLVLEVGFRHPFVPDVPAVVALDLLVLDDCHDAAVGTIAVGRMRIDVVVKRYIIDESLSKSPGVYMARTSVSR